MFRPSFLLAPLALAALAAAQGVLPIAADYRLVELDFVFDGPCGLGAQPSIYSVDGDVTLAVDGSFTSVGNPHYVCFDGSAGAYPPVSGAGIYTIGANGRVELDFSPALPGVDRSWFFLRADGQVGISSPIEVPQNAFLAVLVALSNGRSNADLVGAYQTVRIVARNPGPAPGAFVVEGSASTITFDGTGGFVTAAATRHVLPFGGSASSVPVAGGNGSYAVASDGSLTAGTAHGAVSADGEFFAWLRRGANEAELLVGVRAPTASSAANLAGDWRITSLAASVAAAASPGALPSDWGTMTLTPTGAANGTTSAELLHIAPTPVTTNYGYSYPAGTFAVAPSGSLQLTAPTAVGGVSADGTTMIALLPPGDGIGLLLGVSACSFPHAVGSGLAGAGGHVPFVQSFGGFPYAGNAAFGVLLARGLGGAPALLAWSLAAPSTGLPLFGGTIYLDPLQPIVTDLLLLSGPAGIPAVGAAGRALPLPGSALLAGTAVTAQAFVLDPAAAQGLALSPGFALTICR